MNHLTSDQLLKWRDGLLSEAASLEIEAHLESCAGVCQMLLNTLPGGDPQATPCVPINSASNAPSPPGYEMIKELGRGAMGVVYKARQIQLNRVVALKMNLASSHASSDQVQRFVAEAETVARMQHPNIVQIFETSLHQGVPFFSMEFVAGGTLATKLGGVPLPADEAARLVEVLARGVYYAHQQGVVHRDLKPANVLLTAEGVAKIADFGLAKQVEGGLSLTDSKAIMGSPPYMAPEQAVGQNKNVGPSADLYALGAILYECLTGRPPFRAATTIDTLLQVVQDEPVPPTGLQSKVPKDLETICLKCLRKEPENRYASTVDLAEDLRRFLAGETILARPVGRLERLVKWARRHPAVTALTVALVLAVTVGFGLVTWKWREESDARTVAEVKEREAAQAAVAERSAKEKAEQAAAAERSAKEMAQKHLRQLQKANAIVTSILHDLNPSLEKRGGTPLLVQLADLHVKAAELLEGETVSEPLTVARLQMDLGHNQTNLGYPDRAIKLLMRARQTFEGALGSNHSDTLECLSNLATAYQEAKQLDKALPLFEQTLKKRQNTLGRDHPDTLTSMNNLAVAYRATGQLAKALPLFEETLKLRQAKLILDHPNTLVSMNNLAAAYRTNDQLDDALKLYKLTLEKMKAKLGADHPDTLLCMSNMAEAYQSIGQIDKALSLYQQTLEKLQNKLGPDHPDTLTTMNELAGSLKAKGQLTKALQLYDLTLQKRQARLGLDHPDTLTSMDNLAQAYQENKQLAEALPLYEKALKKRQDKLGRDHPDTLQSLNNLAVACYLDKQLPRALPMLELALKKRQATLGLDNPETLKSATNLAWAYYDTKQLAKAISLYEQTLKLMQTKFAPDHSLTLQCMNNLAASYQDTGQLAKALPLYVKTLEKLKAKLGADHPETLNCLNNLAVAYEESKSFTKAEPLWRELLKAYRKQGNRYHDQTANALIRLGKMLLQQKKYAEAEMPLRECAELLGKIAPKVWFAYYTKSLLGAVLFGQEKYTDAEPLLLQGYEGMKQQTGQIPTAAKFLLVEVAQRLVDLYEAWNRPEPAAQWRKTLVTEQGKLSAKDP